MGEVEGLSSSNEGTTATRSLGHVVDIVHSELVELVVDGDFSQFLNLCWTLYDC